MIYARLGNGNSAETKLRSAFALEPDNAIVTFNLGLLLAERNQSEEAERLLRSTVEADPQMAAAAYNLAVLIAARDLGEAVKWCRKANELRPDEPKYAYTLAFYLNQQGESRESSRVLEELIRRNPGYADAYALLGSTYESRGQLREAGDVYRRAIGISGLTPGVRHQFEAKLAGLPGSREPTDD
jgi:Flp pilus assembly protein TadD